MTSTVIFFLAYPLAFIYQAFFYRTKPVLQVSQSFLFFVIRLWLVAYL